MMMEQEIARTNEEIKGIEEACEKVEQVLERVVKSQGLDMSTINVIEGSESEEGKMEDIVSQTEATDLGQSSEQKWYDDENLLNLWNGNVD
jgi:flagellar motility protein MotE (MotC chaperone)